MSTLRLNTQENALARVMEALKPFTSDEVVIVNEDQNYLVIQNYLFKELEEVNNGNAEMVSHDDLGKSLNEVIEKYEIPLQDIISN